MSYVYLKFNRMNVDPVQYKPYSNEILSDDYEENGSYTVWIRFEVDDAQVIEGQHEKPASGVILTPEGLVSMLGQMAFAIRNRLQ